MPLRCQSCETDNHDGSSFCLRCGSSLEITAADDPLLGRLIHGRYRVRRPVGRGGMGQVYLAHQQLGTAFRPVAVKVLHESHSRSETLRARFHRECEVVLSLSHPNTIQFFDFGELEDGRLFIVMEYVEGRSLQEEIHTGPLPEDRVARLLVQIAGSLGEAHALGIVHRDLKPENILLTTRGGTPDFVKVVDFGIAKRPDDGPTITARGSVVGTPRYMSPEQLTDGEIGPASDIYSLGLLLYEMLAGEPPFSARSAIEWAAVHVTAPPPSLADHEVGRTVAPHRREAVMRALAKEPRARFQTMAELATAFVGSDFSLTPLPVASDSSVASRPPIGLSDEAPTVEESLGAVMQKAGLKPGRRRRLWTIAAFTLAAITSTTAAYIATRPPSGATDPSGEPSWLRIVHFQRDVEGAEHAIGAPDQRYALLPPGATLTLELAPGVRIRSDEGPGADLRIVVDEDRSGPYRVDVGIDRNDFITVTEAATGSLSFDVDQFDVARLRYVRLKNRGEGPVYVDAVGAYRTDADVGAEPASR